MEEQQKTSNIIKIFLGVFFTIFVLSFLIYKLFGFELGIIFSISIATAIVSMGFGGLENTIINKK